MTKEGLAALLNGREYRNEMTKDEEHQAKATGLLVVFGASDDLMEFRGAVDDEMGAYEGTTALLDAEGLLPHRQSIDDDDELKRYFARQPKAQIITAVWHDHGSEDGGYAWTYETDIRHATFDVLEDGERYCRGIVISMSSLAVTS